MERTGPRIDGSGTRWSQHRRPDGDPPSKQVRSRPLVLVVEDDPHDWEIYGKILWYNGFDVCYAADGEDGLRYARRYEPDLLLVDLMLPKMDGLELCRRCRGEPGLADVPIVMISARTRKDQGDRAREAGCDWFLEKPHGPVDVLHCIERLIGRAPPSGEGRPPELCPADARHG